MNLSFKMKIAVVITTIIIASSGVLYTLEVNNIMPILDVALCYVSIPQVAADNSSFSVLFHDINFTFLYWYWPLSQVIENNTVYVAEQRVQVFVSVQTSDGLSEVVQFEIDSSSSCIFNPDPTLLSYTASHASKLCGIATANTEELHNKWVYFVSI
jgi:hypothetical protein